MIAISRFAALIVLTYLACNLLAAPARCRAAEITADGNMVYLRGDIVPGDASKLVILLRKLTAKSEGTPVLDLDSAGGDMKEGLDIGIVVSLNAISVQIDFGSVCYSACFNPFVTAPRRVVFAPARIGVHQLGSGRNATAESMTKRAADLYRSLGVNDSIIQKMLHTNGNSIALLTEREIRLTGPVDYATLSKADIALKLIIRALRDTSMGQAMTQGLTKLKMDQAEVSLQRQMPPPGSDAFWNWYDAVWRNPELLIGP